MNLAQAELLTLKAITDVFHGHPARVASMLDDTQLDVADFTVAAHQALYAALAPRIREGRGLDVVELVKALKGRALPALVSDVVHSSEAFIDESVARARIATLRDAAHRRRMAESLRGLLELVESDTPTEACITEVVRVTTELAGASVRRAASLDGSVMALVEKLEDVQCGRREATLTTGIEALDYAIGGLQPTLTIVGSLPGVGKSALIAGVARNLAKAGTKVGVLSLEDEREWLTERLMAEASNVPLFVLGNKPLTSSQMERVNDCANELHTTLKNIIVDDSLAMTPALAVAAARSMVARGCRAIIVDHLGELRLDRSERHDLDIQEALQDLRGIAKTYRVPVVVLCHLKRREGLNVDAVPKLTDFAFSAAIERCARVALGLFRPKPEAGVPPQVGVEVMKQTKGPRDFNFRLNVGELYGIVQATPVSSGMREKFGAWRES